MQIFRWKYGYFHKTVASQSRERPELDGEKQCRHNVPESPMMPLLVALQHLSNSGGVFLFLSQSNNKIGLPSPPESADCLSTV